MFVTTCFVTEVVNYTVGKKIGCLHLMVLCQQESVFPVLVRPKRLRVISCGENANIGDAVRLRLWPQLLLPLGCVSISTVRGHTFPLSHGACMLENCKLALINTVKHQRVKCQNPSLFPYLKAA